MRFYSITEMGNLDIKGPYLTTGSMPTTSTYPRAKAADVEGAFVVVRRPQSSRRGSWSWEEGEGEVR